jgi:hypothetical protein
MSNGAECCVLQICCPPAEARTALVKKLCDHGCDEVTALSVADYLQAEFDFLPKGTIDLTAVIAMAKKHHGA